MPGAELVTRSIEPIKPESVRLNETCAVSSWMTSVEDHPSWRALGELRVALAVAVALHRFTVKDLLELREGQVFKTLSPTTEDVPLMIGHVQLGWSEFEAVEQRMAMRLTRLG